MTMEELKTKEDMSKIELQDTNSGYNLQKINNNFDKIETEFNEKVLYRDNPDGEPNEMLDDLDMNGNRVFNLPVPLSENEAARLKDVQDAVVGNINANLISFEPAADISADNVQAAIEEVNSKFSNIVLSTVSVGDVDSGGTGYRVLRVPN